MRKAIIFFIVLALSSIACRIEYGEDRIVNANALPTTPSRIHSATPVNTATPYLQKATKTTIPHYKVTGLVYLRDFTGEPKGYVNTGDLVTCLMSGDWCLLENGLKIWAGCLEPGNGKGCSAK